MSQKRNFIHFINWTVIEKNVKCMSKVASSRRNFDVLISHVPDQDVCVLGLLWLVPEVYVAHNQTITQVSSCNKDHCLFRDNIIYFIYYHFHVSRQHSLPIWRNQKICNTVCNFVITHWRKGYRKKKKILNSKNVYT